MTSDQDKRFCGALKQDGSTCRNSAGARTSHPQFGHCYLHSGSSRNGVIHATRLQVEEIASMATDIMVDPKEVLLMSVGRCWGTVHWTASRIHQIEDDKRAHDERFNAGEIDESEHARRVNDLGKLLVAFNKLYGEWIERAGKMSKLAIDAGVSEALVDALKTQSNAWVAVIQNIFGDQRLGLSAEQQALVPSVIDQHLEQLISKKDDDAPVS